VTKPITNKAVIEFYICGERNTVESNWVFAYESGSVGEWTDHCKKRKRLKNCKSLRKNVRKSCCSNCAGLL